MQSLHLLITNYKLQIYNLSIFVPAKYNVHLAVLSYVLDPSAQHAKSEKNGYVLYRYYNTY